MVIDTLLLCFCEDTQMNDGTDGRAYYMGSSLMVSKLCRICIIVQVHPYRSSLLS